MSLKNKHIVHLPEWFPNAEDPQLGVFILKHIVLTKDFSIPTVIYVQGKKEDILTPIQIEEKEGVAIIRGYYKQRKGILRFINYLSYLKRTKQCFTHLEKQPDALHLHVIGRNAAFAYYFKWKSKLPYYVTVHWNGWLTDHFSNNRLKSWLVKKLLKNAQGIAAVSPLLQKAVVNFASVPVEIIPNVVESILRTECNRDTRLIKVLVVADLVDDIKNISGIIAAFSELETTDTYHFQLDIIGDGKDYNKLNNLATKLTKTQIHFLGRKSNPEVLAAYQNYDFLISNSRRETFGLVLAEAIMSGIPVISTKCGGPESFVTCENGLLIPSDDKSALISAILQMSKSYKSYTEEALKQSLSQFEATKIKATLKNWYAKDSN